MVLIVEIVSLRVFAWYKVIAVNFQFKQCERRLFKHTTCIYIMIFTCIRFEQSRIRIQLRYRSLFGAVNIRVYRYGKGKEMFYLTTHSTHFIYSYMASDIKLRTNQIAREETQCHHMGYSFQLTARVLLYAPSHRQDSTYHSLCYTSRGALAGMKNNSVGQPHEGSIRRPIAPWANALTTELYLAPCVTGECLNIWHAVTTMIQVTVQCTEYSSVSLHNYLWPVIYKPTIKILPAIFVHLVSPAPVTHNTTALCQFHPVKQKQKKI